MSTVNNNLNNATVPLTPSFGGTGIANTGTFTVGGNTAFSGAFTFTGTITGNTTVTFPTSGTLQTTTGASGTVNSGTANQIAYYATSTNAVSGLTGANGSVLVTNNTGVPSMLANPTADNRHLASANAAIPKWTTSSYADTYAVSTVLYASSSNTVTGLATTNAASLSTNSSGVPTWLALTDGQVVVGSTAGSPAAATLTAGTNITITNASNSITINSTAAGGVSWANISGTTQTAAVNTGYVIGNASATTVTLPVTAALGSIVAIQGKGAGGWVLAAGTGQTIQVGQTASTTAGSVTSAAAFDAIQVVCITANTTWATSYVLSSGVTVA
jgi:hypothetical protein